MKRHRAASWNRYGVGGVRCHLTNTISSAEDSTRPLATSLGLGQVDPGLVDVNWVSPDAEVFIQQDVLQSWSQGVAQGVLTVSVTVEVHQHLDHSWVTCDDILRFLHLQADIRTQTRLVQDRTLCPHQCRDLDR